MRILKLEPALLSETLVLVPLTPRMGVLIAAILNKLSIEVVPKCVFFSSTYSRHSYPPFYLYFSRSHFSVLHLWGQVMNGVPALIGWCMMLLSRMKAYITQRTGNRKGEKEEESAEVERDIEMFWQAALKERKDRGVLQMLAWNNGSRSQFHWCLNRGTLPLGNSPTDLLPASSASLWLPLPVWRRHADCAVPSAPPWGMWVRAWAKLSRGGGTPRWPSVLQRLCHKLLFHLPY